MSDDIVTRLRGQACPECGLPSTHNQFDEAADEIERLRMEVARLRELHRDLSEHLFTLENAIKAIYEKAVGND